MFMILPALLCRVKYGNANGKHQEEESAALIEEFFADSDLPKEFVNRVSYIVSHHHTITGIDGIDYQIMIEADYLVNADESNFSGNNVRNMLEKVFKTETGKFLATVYVSAKIQMLGRIKRQTILRIDSE